MFYLEENGEIITANEDRAVVEIYLIMKPSCGLEVLETERPIVFTGENKFEFADAPEYLAKELEAAKALKHAENVQKRDERLRAGVEYKGVMFDSDTDSKINIMGAVSTLPDDTVVGWNSMDNQTVTLTKPALAELGGLLVALTSEIWGENGLNVQFINAINVAQTVEEVEGVLVDYSKECSLVD